MDKSIETGRDKNTTIEYHDTPPMWAIPGQESTIDHFVHGEDYEDIDHHRWTPWSIYYQRDHYEKVSDMDVWRENPHSVIYERVAPFSMILSVAVTVFVLVGAITAWSLFVWVIPVLFKVHYSKYRGYIQDDYIDDIDPDDPDYIDHSLHPVLARKHRWERTTSGAVFADRIPNEVLAKYDVTRELVRSDTSDTFTVDDLIPSFFTKAYHENSETEKKRYTHVITQALGNAINDPESEFQTRKLVNTLIDYNESVTWDSDNKVLTKLLDSLFSIVDDAWERKKEQDKRDLKHQQHYIEKQEKELNEIESRKKEAEQQRQELKRQQALGKVERAINTVEAFNDLKEEDPFHPST